MSSHKLKKGDKQIIKLRWLVGRSQATLGRMFGVSTSRIGQILAEVGVTQEERVQRRQNMRSKYLITNEMVTCPRCDKWKSQKAEFCALCRKDMMV